MGTEHQQPGMEKGNRHSEKPVDPTMKHDEVGTSDCGFGGRGLLRSAECFAQVSVMDRKLERKTHFKGACAELPD